MKVVVMGVAGSGKSTLGAEIAKSLGCTFVDADDLHPAENIAHMSSGRPLTDAMRWPWLDACGAAMQGDDPIVLGCSALKRAYRDRLRNAVPELRLVYPHVTEQVIRSRFKQRKGHFMPEALISSQFTTLEAPLTDENPVIVPSTFSIQQAVQLVVSNLLAK